MDSLSALAELPASSKNIFFCHTYKSCFSRETVRRPKGLSSVASTCCHCVLGSNQRKEKSFSPLNNRKLIALTSPSVEVKSRAFVHACVRKVSGITHSPSFHRAARHFSQTFCLSSIVVLETAESYWAWSAASPAGTQPSPPAGRASNKVLSFGLNCAISLLDQVRDVSALIGITLFYFP